MQCVGVGVSVWVCGHGRVGVHLSRHVRMCACVYVWMHAYVSSS